jgi:FlaA1/EpsC-like NDP-sugar epimerase
VTVVHPDITRYFMTIPEACQLTIQAGAIGTPGDVMVLDMGVPMRILDVAKRLIRESGRHVDIIFTGLRPGEKLHESLFNDNETAGATSHPLISQVAVPPVDPEGIRSALPGSFLAGARLGSRV